MEEPAGFNPKALRQPFADVTNRRNANEPSRLDHEGHHDDQGKSPDRMSIATSLLSPRINPENDRLSPIPDSRAGSNRNSASGASIISGKGKRKTHVGPWQLGKTLGKGATGRVRLAKHAGTGQTAAVKIVSKKSAAMVQSESIAAMDRNARRFSSSGVRPMPCGIEREVVIMKLIEHPNVISLYDVWENRGELYLVLEYVDGGELFDYVSEKGPLPEEEAVRLFRQIIAGLGYCHRFNICHRDLKPENILLDSSHNIKLADFGMAALQPIGHWLNTSCGSPHYAAPEIIYGRRYRGDKADIWSCGIILYALLTGYLPFDGGDLPSTLQLVKRGEYIIPHEMSYEAADLVKRILQKRPEDRISMQGIWKHPLLRKYEKLHQAMSNHTIGPPPPVSTQDCGALVASRQDIDVDLLRSLQTLWHDAKPEALVEKLLSKEPTQERLFYNALIKFRDDQLENYEGPSLEYSASDYHHISRGPRAINRRHSNRRYSTLRGRSHFSIMKDRIGWNDCVKDSKPSAETYDPPKLARTRGPASDEPQQAHELNRKESGAARKQPMAHAVTAHRAHANEGLDGETKSPECSHFEILPNRKPKLTSVKSFQSQSSKSRSRSGFHIASAPRSASYKRNVSFRHIRNRSQASTLRNPASQSSLRTAADAADAARLSELDRSPSLPVQPATVRSGAGVRVVKNDIAWKDETRKVSAELSKICEEAFNASSVSTVRTSSLESTETAATSMSLERPEDSHHLLAGEKPKVSPSLDTSAVSPKHYTVSELLQTRHKLIEHSTREGSDKVPTYLAGVITHLDRLIEQNKTKKAAQPEDPNEQPLPLHDLSNRTSNDAGFLPVINEELRTPTGSKTDVKQDSVGTLRHQSGNSPPKCSRRATVRLVAHSSLGSIEEVKPLNVRKKTPISQPGDSQPPLKEEEAKPGSVRHEDLFDRFVASEFRDGRLPCELDPIQESPRAPTGDSGGAPIRKWSFLNHRSQAGGRSRKHREHVDVQPVGHSAVPAAEHEPKREKGSGYTSPKTPCGTFKGSFFNFMRKKQKDNTADKPAKPVVADSSHVKGNEADNAPEPSPQRPTQQKKQPKVRNQNWFARVFQIKPATRVIALDTSNAKGRREVFRILNEWQQYGMEDVYMDKANNYVHGRVGEVNFLRLRPVEFSAEFFTVLEEGRYANLCLVRFTQERGAASSFSKVVDTLQIVMKQRHILVEDPARAKKMSKVLDDFPA